MFETGEYVPVSIEEFQESISKWNIDDWQLWEFFRGEYGDSPIGYFDQIDEIRLNAFRLFFIERGVWIQQEISAAAALTNTFKEKEFQSIQQHQSQKTSPSATAFASPTARSEIPKPRSAPLKISKPPAAASAPPAARSEISTPSTSGPAPSEIPKPPSSVSAFLPEPQSAPHPAPQQQSSVQQTPSRPTSSNPPQSSQPPISFSHTATSGTAATILNPKSPQAAAPIISLIPLRAATSFTTLIITSGCISYKKGMG